MTKAWSAKEELERGFLPTRRFSTFGASATRAPSRSAPSRTTPVDLATGRCQLAAGQPIRSPSGRSAGHPVTPAGEFTFEVKRPDHCAARHLLLPVLGGTRHMTSNSIPLGSLAYSDFDTR